jgi:hypothetical protein
MRFTTPNLGDLMATPGSDSQVPAERANLCLEVRVSADRQTRYEGRVVDADSWNGWRASHFRYIREDVRRRHPLSTAFDPGEPSLRPGVEPNQWLIRIERIDNLLKSYTADSGKPVDAAEINRWIKSAQAPGAVKGAKATSLTDLGQLLGGGKPPSPEVEALAELTGFFNQERADGRPSFVAFDAEFPGLSSQTDWATDICERCGLAHLFAGCPVTLALFRYRVQEVLDSQPAAYRGATVFAVPTVLDQPFYNVFLPAPGPLDWGQAVGLSPQDDCGHLAAELIHAPMDYTVGHWVRVGMLSRPARADAEIDGLRARHLDCLRSRPELADYGRDC